VRGQRAKCWKYVDLKHFVSFSTNTLRFYFPQDSCCTPIKGNLSRWKCLCKNILVYLCLETNPLKHVSAFRVVWYLWHVMLRLLQSPLNTTSHPPPPPPPPFRFGVADDWFIVIQLIAQLNVKIISMHGVFYIKGTIFALECPLSVSFWCQPKNRKCVNCFNREHEMQ